MAGGGAPARREYPILPGVLDKDEIAWLNDYHRQVFAKLAPHLNDEERSWLAEKCAAIGC